MFEWISVEERLPEMFEPVLVAQENNAVFMGTYEGLMGWSSQNKFLIEAPTHWMPIPEGPNEQTVSV